MITVTQEVENPAGSSVGSLALLQAAELSYKQVFTGLIMIYKCALTVGQLLSCIQCNVTFYYYCSCY